MNVSLKVNESGALVTPYEGSPEYGYVVLNSTETIFQNGWVQSKDRSAIIKGKVADLTKMFSVGQKLAGKIAVTECTEDKIPAHLSALFNKNQTLEENIAPYLKRAGKDGVILLSDGKRILRFTSYDDTGSQADARVQHDNIAEIKAQNAKADSSQAEFPS